MVSEILQERLGILVIKREYIKNETQTVEKRRLLASYLLSALFGNPRKESGNMRKFCVCCAVE